MYVLETERLMLRKPTLDDAESLSKAINDERVAATTLNVPSPYSVDDARAWIGKHLEVKDEPDSYHFSIFLKGENDVIGGVGLPGVDGRFKNAELGYWAAYDYWGKGIVTEAASAVVKFGFEELGLNRIYAFCFESNPASARVMEKVGMKFEGISREAVLKDDKFINLRNYAIIKSDLTD